MNAVSDVHGIKTAYKSQTSNASTARALNMRLSFRDKKYYSEYFVQYIGTQLNYHAILHAETKLVFCIRPVDHHLYSWRTRHNFQHHLRAWTNALNNKNKTRMLPFRYNHFYYNDDDDDDDNGHFYTKDALSVQTTYASSFLSD